MRLLFLIVGLALTLFWISGARSQEAVDPSTPIRIEADRMESSQERNIVTFSGHVRASQGGFNIQADTMTVIYTRDGLAPGASGRTSEDLTRKIDKITAQGNVKIVQEDWLAAGDTMDYNANAGTVILEGNAKAWQEQNMVSGERIVLYLDEGKSIVESTNGDGERVKAFIYPSAPDQPEPEKP